MRATVIGLAMLGLVGASADAGAAQELRIAEKDPAIALGFALLCPGCGHLYSGETAKGAVIAAISVGSVATGLSVQLARANRPFEDCGWTAYGTYCERQDAAMDLTPILVGSAIGLAGYLYGLIDAGPSARRMNERQGGLGALHVRPNLAADGSVRTDLGVRVRTRW